MVWTGMGAERGVSEGSWVRMWERSVGERTEASVRNASS